MIFKHLLIILVVVMAAGCTPGVLNCFLRFEDYQSIYKFGYSKDELKRRIVESFSYGNNSLVNNIGKTLIENEEVNQKYRTSTINWLDKKNWNNYKGQILNDMTDTLTIIIGKHHSRKSIRFKAVIDGGQNYSVLRIEDVEYIRRKKCVRESRFYQDLIEKIIERKFIVRLK